MEGIIVIDCGYAMGDISRARVLDKVKPLIENEPEILNLIHSFLHVPIHGLNGKEFTLNKGLPSLP